MTMDWQAVHDMERDVSENKEMYQALADGDIPTEETSTNGSVIAD